MMPGNEAHMVLELQSLFCFVGALVAVTLAVMTQCSLVAPSDTAFIRFVRKLAFGGLAVSLMLLSTWGSFTPSYAPSIPGTFVVGMVDVLLVVSLVSALNLNRQRRRRPGLTNRQGEDLTTIASMGG